MTNDLPTPAVLKTPCCAVRMFLVLWALVFVGCNDEAGSTGVLMQKVYMHEDRGEYPEAIAAISQLIERDPENATLYYDRGVFHEAIGETDESVADYTETIKRSPGHPQALNNRAAILARQGKLDQAIIDLDEAIKHNPTNALAHRNRGEAYMNLKQPEAALADLDEAATFDPSDPLTFFVRGSLHLEQGRPYAALEDAAVACHLDPDLESAKSLRQEVYVQLGVADPRAAPALPDGANVAASSIAGEAPAEVEDLETAPAP